jgi:hypothetical protein
VKTKKGPRYTPVSRRHDRPNAVLWLLRNHPELKDSQLMRLVGTTKPTILQIRERTHWNSPNLVPQDPVTLGLCSQTDLDAEVTKAAKRAQKDRGPIPAEDAERAGTLLSTSETTGYGLQPDERALRDEEPEVVESQRDEDARILAQLKGLQGGAEADDEDDEESAGHAEADDADDDAAEKSRHG